MDLVSLDLDKIISIKDKKIEIYPDDIFEDKSKPKVGQELNVSAKITFYNMKPNNVPISRFI